jgi:hypothetical protein
MIFTHKSMDFPYHILWKFHRHFAFERYKFDGFSIGFHGIPQK